MLWNENSLACGTKINTYSWNTTKDAKAKHMCLAQSDDTSVIFQTLSSFAKVTSMSDRGRISQKVVYARLNAMDAAAKEKHIRSEPVKIDLPLVDCVKMKARVLPTYCGKHMCCKGCERNVSNHQIP